jgi:hypothetical protein
MRIDRYSLPLLPIGAMMRKDGTATKLPWPFPPMMTTHGNAWVMESTPTKLRIREQDVNWRHVPVTFDQTLSITRPGRVDFVTGGTVFGVRTPSLKRSYDILDAGRGWIELRSAGHPRERVSSFRTDGRSFSVDCVGPAGTYDHKTLPIIRPGERGYMPPPAGWGAPA